MWSWSILKYLTEKNKITKQLKIVKLFAEIRKLCIQDMKHCIQTLYSVTSIEPKLFVVDVCALVTRLESQQAASGAE